MITELTKAIVTSIFDVLETMFYMIVEIDESGTLEDCRIMEKGKIYGCTLGFRGILTGVFMIFIPEDLLISMATDFMGEDETNIANGHIE